jgi:hypothetical protein
MTPPSSDRVKVRTDGLAAFYSALATALTENGLSGARLNELFAKSVAAECVQCGTALSGDEMGALALADPNAELANPKLRRLKLGYCGSAGCNSYFYMVSLNPYPDVDWSQIVAKVESRTAPLEHEPVAVPEIALPASPRRKLFLRVAVGVLIILVLLLIRHVWSGGRIPLLQSAPKYQVDPATTGDGGVE